MEMEKDQYQFQRAVQRAAEIYLARTYSRFILNDPLSIREWIEVVDDIALDDPLAAEHIREVIAMVSHRARKVQVEALETGGFTTSGAAASKVCGAGLSVCPLHARDKGKVVMSRIAEALDRKADNGLDQHFFVTVTFTKGAAQTRSASNFLGVLRTGDRRVSRAAKDRDAAAKKLRSVRVVLAPEDVMIRQEKSRAWSPYVHLHGVVAVDNATSPEDIQQWRETVGGRYARAKVEKVRKTAVRAAKYCLKSDLTLGRWEESDTWMGVGRAVDLIARDDAGEPVDAAAVEAAWQQFERWLSTKGAGNPYVPAARNSLPESTIHRSGLDALYGGGHGDDADTSADADADDSPATPTPASPDTDADLRNLADFGIPRRPRAAEHGDRSPRRRLQLE